MSVSSNLNISAGEWRFSWRYQGIPWNWQPAWHVADTQSIFINLMEQLQLQSRNGSTMEVLGEWWRR